MGQGYRRSDRVGEQILHDMAEMYAAEFSDRMGHLITFTQVRMSSDLRYVVVYYSYLGPEERGDAIQAYLTSNHKRVRFELGRKLSIRHIPEFSFKFDPSIKEGLKIEKLLNEINSDSKQN